MAHRIRNLETMTLREVDAIFCRGRGIGISAQHDSRDGDFTPDVEQAGPENLLPPMRRINSESYVGPAQVVDDELESVR